MKIRLWLLCILVIFAHQSSSFAQEELSQDDLVAKFTSYFESRTFAECHADIETLRRSAYNSNGELTIKYRALRKLEESIRLQCERTRLFGQRERLKLERLRLLGEVDRLDREWRKAHNADPSKYPDTPGRDRSQKQMRADARLMFGDISKNTNDMESLNYNSEQGLRDTIAIDSGVQNDLLQRLLGATVPVPTS